MNALKKTKNIIAGMLLVLVTGLLLNACSDESAVYIVLNHTGQQTFEKGDTIKFKANVQVLGSENIDTTITWTSSKPEVAKIDASGLLVAVDTGKTEITASLKNGKYAMSEVRVSALSAKKLVLSDLKLLLEANGADTTLTVRVFPATIMAIYPVEWSSSNPAVVAVDSITKDSVSTKVRVRPLTAGKATITMKLGKSSVSCAITVAPKVSVAEEELYLTVNGRESEVIASINEALMVKNEDIKWRSSDESVLRIKVIKQITGKTTAIVQPLNEGDVKLIVSTGKNADTCLVHVGATLSLSWQKDNTLNLKSVTMYCNETMDLPVFATITPDDDYYINKMIYLWSSSAGSIVQTESAQRDPNNSKSSVCKLKAGATEGTATITVKSRGQEVKAIVTVKDRSKIDVTSISLDKNEALVAAGNYIVLTSTVLPVGVVVVHPVIWTSSDESVATVNSDGKVTGMAVGTAVITAKSKDKLTTCTVTVIDVATSILINTSSRDVLMLGDFETWIAKVTTSSGSNVFPISWTSSDPTVATVSNTGKVTALTVGTSTITATAGDKTTTRIVRVVPVRANVNFGSKIDEGGWDLSGKKLTVKVEDGAEVYDFVINLANSQSSLQNGVYTINNQISSATITWSTAPQVTANISSGTVEVKTSSSRDKIFIFNFNVNVGDKIITIQGTRDFDRI